MREWKYILGAAGNPIEEPDLHKWAEWLENSRDRVLQQDQNEEYFISTVFLGIDMGFGGQPLLFETMVFRKLKKPKKVLNYTMRREEEEMDRYATRQQAMDGHKRLCKKYGVK